MKASASGRDLSRTQEDILRVATEHFTRNGYHGARVDEIAAETSTTKRMIYYCFGSKDGLFEACLGRAYGEIRRFEQELHLADLAPREAIARYVSETVRYHEAHPELARLVRAENLLGGVHITVGGMAPLSQPIVETLDEVLSRGRASGEFVDSVTGLDLHLVVSALGNFRITNEPTIRALFGRSMRDEDLFEHDIDQYVAMTLGWLTDHDTSTRTDN